MPRATSGSDVFHAIADGNRRRLLDVLRDGEEPVGALVQATGLSYSVVSQHLAVLLEAQMVARRAEGRERLYQLQPDALRPVHDWTATYERFWRARLARLRRFLDEQS